MPPCRLPVEEGHGITKLVDVSPELLHNQPPAEDTVRQHRAREAELSKHRLRRQWTCVTEADPFAGTSVQRTRSGPWPARAWDQCASYRSIPTLPAAPGVFDRPSPPFCCPCMHARELVEQYLPKPIPVRDLTETVPLVPSDNQFPRHPESGQGGAESLAMAWLKKRQLLAAEKMPYFSVARWRRKNSTIVSSGCFPCFTASARASMWQSCSPTSFARFSNATQWRGW